MTDEEGQTSEVNFYPRPPRGGRQALALKTAAGQEFLSTPSARRATFLELSFPKAIKHFYPRPPRGGRQHPSVLPAHVEEFLSTPSARRATRRPASAGRPAEISIHALREEGDFAGVAPFGDCFLFLSTPSARRATSDRLSAHGFLLFLSTPSARRATVQRRVDSSAGGNFYPRPPRGGRPGPRRSRPGKSSNFYPRPPRGGRRHGNSRACHSPAISIHALREEGDRDACSYCRSLVEFLSTPSARRATRT